MYPTLTATTITAANPTVITTLAHGLWVGATYRAIFSGTDCTPSLDGEQEITVTSTTQFTVPVAVTGAGTAGTVNLTAFATLDDLNKTLGSDNDNYGPEWNIGKVSLIDDTTAEFEREIGRARGGSNFAVVALGSSQRMFTGKPGPTNLLPIDDCTSVASVVVSGQTWVSGTDYLPFPLNGTPYTGLLALPGRSWSGSYGGSLVTASWGLFTRCPGDLHRAVLVEATRAFLSARAGDSDAIGLTPFGSVVTAKAFTSKSWQLIQTYGFGGGMLR